MTSGKDFDFEARNNCHTIHVIPMSKFLFY